MRSRWTRWNASLSNARRSAEKGGIPTGGPTYRKPRQPRWSTRTAFRSFGMSRRASTKSRFGPGQHRVQAGHDPPGADVRAAHDRGGEYPARKRARLQVPRANRPQKGTRQTRRLLRQDEPTSPLSQYEAEQLFGIIARLKDRGVSVIDISHRLEEIFQIADEVTALRDGRVTAPSPAVPTS